MTTTGFIDESSLDFDGPTASATTAALDGNALANQGAITSTIDNIIWNPGEELLLRWSDVNNDGNDHGLAIDNFEFSASVTPPTGIVPEPTSLLVWGVVGLIGIACKQKFA